MFSVPVPAASVCFELCDSPFPSLSSTFSNFSTSKPQSHQYHTNPDSVHQRQSTNALPDRREWLYQSLKPQATTKQDITANFLARAIERDDLHCVEHLSLSTSGDYGYQTVHYAYNTSFPRRSLLIYRPLSISRQTRFKLLERYTSHHTYNPPPRCLESSTNLSMTS